jgi:hypothetical protein
MVVILIAAELVLQELLIAVMVVMLVVEVDIMAVLVYHSCRMLPAAAEAQVVLVVIPLPVLV